MPYQYAPLYHAVYMLANIFPWGEELHLMHMSLGIILLYTVHKNWTVAEFSDHNNILLHYCNHAVTFIEIPFVQCLYHGRVNIL